MEIPEILDVEDLAELLRLTKPTIRDLIKENILPGYKIGQGKYIVTKRYLLDFIDENTANPRPPEIDELELD